MDWEKLESHLSASTIAAIAPAKAYLIGQSETVDYSSVKKFAQAVRKLPNSKNDEYRSTVYNDINRVLVAKRDHLMQELKLDREKLTGSQLVEAFYATPAGTTLLNTAALMHRAMVVNMVHKEIQDDPKFHTRKYDKQDLIYIATFGEFITNIENTAQGRQAKVEGKALDKDDQLTSANLLSAFLKYDASHVSQARLSTYLGDVIESVLYNYTHDSKHKKMIRWPGDSQRAMKDTGAQGIAKYFIDKGEDIVEQLDAKQFKQRLAEALDSLPPRESAILKKRSEGLTLEQVGQIHGISKERTRHLEARAIRKLREPLQLDALSEFLGQDMRHADLSDSPLRPAKKKASAGGLASAQKEPHALNELTIQLKDGYFGNPYSNPAASRLLEYLASIDGVISAGFDVDSGNNAVSVIMTNEHADKYGLFATITCNDNALLERIKPFVEGYASGQSLSSHHRY